MNYRSARYWEEHNRWVAEIERREREETQEDVEEQEEKNSG
jgi:hypothetical protein